MGVKNYNLYNIIDDFESDDILSWELVSSNIDRLEKVHKENIYSFVIHYHKKELAEKTELKSPTPKSNSKKGSLQFTTKPYNIKTCKGGSGVSIPPTIPEELKIIICKYVTVIVSI